MLRVWVAMTGPVIRGRAGRTPLPLMHLSKLSGFPMLPPLSPVSNFCTFAQEHRSDLHFCTASLTPSGPPVLVSSNLRRYAMMPLTTFAGSTPVSRKSNPW